VLELRVHRTEIWTGRDLNPRPPDCEAKTYGSGDSLCSDGVHCGESEAVDWDAFKVWLNKTYRPKTVYDILFYVKQYYHCLLDKDFKPLLDLSKDKRVHCMAALSALSKFLGIHEQFAALVKNYGLKWSIRSDDLLIARFTKTSDPNDVFDWIKQVKASCIDLKDFIDFMATTGMRYEEAVESYNLIIKLSREGKLNEYYKEDREILEHFRFKEIFLRRTKKAFMSFVPKELVERIRDNKPLNPYTIQTKVKRKTNQLRFGDIRELHGTLLTRNLSEVEINFLHGRVSSSVFMTNYFNPTWLSDLKQRTFKSVRAIMQRTI
jgi:intergrase/recombinase